MSKLSRIVQLTGFSDAVYAEAIVNVHQYDILMGKCWVHILYRKILIHLCRIRCFDRQPDK